MQEDHRMSRKAGLLEGGNETLLNQINPARNDNIGCTRPLTDEVQAEPSHFYQDSASFTAADL